MFNASSFGDSVLLSSAVGARRPRPPSVSLCLRLRLVGVLAARRLHEIDLTDFLRENYFFAVPMSACVCVLVIAEFSNSRTCANLGRISQRPCGLEVWFLLWVQEVPGSNPGSAPFLFFISVIMGNVMDCFSNVSKSNMYLVSILHRISVEKIDMCTSCSKCSYWYRFQLEWMFAVDK